MFVATHLIGFGSGGPLTQTVFGTSGGTLATTRSVDPTNGHAGVRFTAPHTGTIISVTWYVNGGGGGADDNYNCHIYTDDGGSPSSPSTLVASSTSQQAPASGEMTYTIAASVTSGVVYWVVLEALVNSIANFDTVDDVTGFASGRNPTITSIDSSGQVPDTTTDDWKVSLTVEH